MIRAPQFKDSGVAWLGQIPTRWSINYLGNVVEVAGGSTPSKENLAFWNGDVPWVSPKDMKREVVSDSEDHVTDLALRGTSLRLIPNPAVLMVIRGMILDHTVPIAITAVPVTVNQDMKALRPRSGIIAEFLAHFLRAMNEALLARVEEAGHGTKALRTDLWRKLPVLVPSTDEQRAIVWFLDRKTATIDALIAKKERLIELLQEKRQALITQAVTKGLDPNVPMKESGVEGLGVIPGHWTLRHLKHLGQIRSGVTKGRDIAGKATIARPYLRVANVQNGWLDLEDVATIEVTREEGRRYAPRAGDVLMNEGGDFDKLGRGYVWEAQIPDCIHQNHVFAVRPRRGVNPLWVNLATQASYLRHFFILRSKQSTNLASISATNLGEAPVPIPPGAEVEAILGQLRVGLERLDHLSGAVSTHIDKLREYRQALITAAVTGKIDVSRDAA